MPLSPSKIDAVIARALAITNAPGAAVAVIDKEGNHYIQGYGVKNARHR